MSGRHDRPMLNERPVQPAHPQWTADGDQAAQRSQAARSYKPPAFRRVAAIGSKSLESKKAATKAVGDRAARVPSGGSYRLEIT
jgi:hypothetical protein